MLNRQVLLQFILAADRGALHAAGAFDYFAASSLSVNS